MKTIIKKWGNSSVIVLSHEELLIRGLKTGDIVEIRLNRVSSGSHSGHKKKPIIK